MFVPRRGREFQQCARHLSNMRATSFSGEIACAERGATAKFGHKQSFVGRDERRRATGDALLRTRQPSQLIDQDAQQSTGRSLDQFLASPRQQFHRMVFSQFVQQVVDTCFGARPNSLDDANVDPPPSVLSVHSASRREGATPFRRVIQQDLGTGQRHTISRRCRSVSAAIQTLVWSDREIVNMKANAMAQPPGIMIEERAASKAL